MLGKRKMSVCSMSDMEFRPRFKKKSKSKQKFTGYNVNMADSANNSFFIGIIWIGTTNNTLPSNVGKCKATFIHSNATDDPILNLNFEDCDVIVKVTTDLSFLEGSLCAICMFSVYLNTFALQVLYQVKCLLYCLIKIRVGFLLKFILLVYL